MTVPHDEAASTAAAMVADDLPDIATDDGLLCALARIADEGWEGTLGRAVLRYARDDVVTPQVRRAGLSGAAAEQASATGWAVAWQLLDRGLPRTTRSPWGTVAVAVRRAVLGEALAHRYGTTVRTAWRLRENGVPWPLSLEAMVDKGHEPEAAGTGPEAMPVLTAVTTALAAAGWDPDDVLALLEWAAARAAGRRRPWCALAAHCGVSVRDVRRAATLLVGRSDWPGLVERVVRQGAGVLAQPELRTALADVRVVTRRAS